MRTLQHIVSREARWRVSVCLLLAVLSLTAQGAEPLVGSWQAQLPQTNTNMGLVQRSVVFSNNGSFQIKDVIRVHTNTSTVPLVGTYTIVDTNHLTLEIAFAPTVSTNKQLFSVQYQVQGDELILENWSSFDPRSSTKYRRVTK